MNASAPNVVNKSEDVRWPPVVGDQERRRWLVGLLLHSLDSSLMPCSIAGETPIIVHMLFNYCFNHQLRNHLNVNVAFWEK